MKKNEVKETVNTSEIINTEANIKACNAATERIRKQLDNISGGYVKIAGEVKRLFDLKAWELSEKNYSGLGEMCADLFGMEKSTTSELKKIGTICFDDKYKIKPAYKNMGYSELKIICKTAKETRDFIETMETPEVAEAAAKKAIDDLRSQANIEKKVKESSEKIEQMAKQEVNEFKAVNSFAINCDEDFKKQIDSLAIVIKEMINEVSRTGVDVVFEIPIRH